MRRRPFSGGKAVYRERRGHGQNDAWLDLPTKARAKQHEEIRLGPPYSGPQKTHFPYPPTPRPGDFLVVPAASPHLSACLTGFVAEPPHSPRKPITRKTQKANGFLRRDFPHRPGSRQRAQRAPQKNADPTLDQLSRAPRAHGVHTPRAGATATPQRSSRVAAGIPVGATHTSPPCPPGAPAQLSAASKPRSPDPLACDLQPQLASLCCCVRRTGCLNCE
jgi:hypothetical protein